MRVKKQREKKERRGREESTASLCCRLALYTALIRVVISHNGSYRSMVRGRGSVVDLLGKRPGNRQQTRVTAASHCSKRAAVEPGVHSTGNIKGKSWWGYEMQPADICSTGKECHWLIRWLVVLRSYETPIIVLSSVSHRQLRMWCPPFEGLRYNVDVHSLWVELTLIIE